jgi:hypothetical protein
MAKTWPEAPGGTLRKRIGNYLNGEAEFTINGRTAKIQAPAIVPCKMGDSHAIYNPSGEQIRWLNFAVSLNKGRY